MKIGVFDSGIGGITVLTALRQRFPQAHFVYLGDTANVPYGTRSPSQIRMLASSAVARLKSHALDALVVACNTASSLALTEIRETMDTVPVIDVVEAGVQATLGRWRAFDPENRILILATRATVRSQIYSRLLGGATNDTARIVEQACPLLVPMIEEGWIDHPILHETIAEYVRPHLNDRPGVALLACTHYPWIQGPISKALTGWSIVNSATAVADLLESRLGSQGTGTGAATGQGRIEWIFTDPDVVPKFALEMFPA